jgi:hypothetical protein
MRGVVSMRLKKLLAKTLSLLIYGAITSLVAFLAALLLHKFVNIKVYDLITIIGLIIVVVGALSSIGGNPTGVGILGMGQQNVQYMSNYNIEVTSMERKITKYFESTANQTKLYFNSKWNVISIGIFVIALSIVLSVI